VSNIESRCNQLKLGHPRVPHRLCGFALANSSRFQCEGDDKGVFFWEPTTIKSLRMFFKNCQSWTILFFRYLFCKANNKPQSIL